MLFRSAPVLTGPSIGRYGVDREPGAANVDDNDPFQTTTGTGGYSWTASGSNSFADLQGRRIVFIRPPADGAITPTLVASSTVTDLASAALLEDAIDDPYESRLDGTSNNDSTFSIAELERILRANDPDAMQLPLPDACCDVVSIAFGIRNVTEPAKALREFYRVLRPGGRLVILEFSLPRNPVMLAEIGRAHV
mgnify:CR=1 FL=1